MGSKGKPSVYCSALSGGFVLTEPEGHVEAQPALTVHVVDALMLLCPGLSIHLAIQVLEPRVLG